MRTGLSANHASEPSLHGGPPPVFPTQTSPQQTKIRQPPKKKKSGDREKTKNKNHKREGDGDKSPLGRPTHHHPPASPRPADPKCPLPQSCPTTACACRVSRQSWRASTDAPPTPHQTHFPPTFTRFATHTTKCTTPHSCTMTAHTQSHPIAHVPSRLQHQRHAYTTRATLPTSAPPKTPPFPTTWPHTTGHTTPMPWPGPPQPPCFSEPDTPCVRWNRRGGHSTHLHPTRPVPGRRGPFSLSASADPPSAAERAMRD